MVKGRLYGTKYYKHVEGDAALISDKYLREDELFNYPSIDAEANDCLVHVVNYALRYPLFTDREQVIRLVMKRLKSNLEDAQLAKAETGVSIDAFRDFFLHGHTVYSLAPLTRMHTFQDEGTIVSTLKGILREHLGSGKGQHKQLIVIGYGTGEECDYCHATALLSFPGHPGHPFIQNQDYPAGCWADKQPVGTASFCDYLTYEDAFDRYKAFRLYYLLPKTPWNKSVMC